METLKQTLGDNLLAVFLACCLVVFGAIGLEMYKWRHGDLNQYAIQTRQSR